MARLPVCPGNPHGLRGTGATVNSNRHTVQSQLPMALYDPGLPPTNGILNKNADWHGSGGHAPLGQRARQMRDRAATGITRSRLQFGAADSPNESRRSLSTSLRSPSRCCHSSRQRTAPVELLVFGRRNYPILEYRIPTRRNWDQADSPVLFLKNDKQRKLRP